MEMKSNKYPLTTRDHLITPLLIYVTIRLSIVCTDEQEKRFIKKKKMWEIAGE
jgi:hypothetical protein